MSGHTTQVILRATPSVAYDYLTRPALWHEWHHSSLGAEPHAAESLRMGDAFREQIKSLGIRKELHWHVLKSDIAKEWLAEATMADGSHVRVHYQFAPAGAKTLFTRTLRYTLKPWSLKLLNLTVGWLKLRRDTQRALQKLQRHFEMAQPSSVVTSASQDH
ncbi:SRPBCC family protein [Ahniella affigens]|nr:SRPBCC family protein [Ahniella affigens]